MPSRILPHSHVQLYQNSWYAWFRSSTSRTWMIRMGSWTERIARSSHPIRNILHREGGCPALYHPDRVRRVIAKGMESQDDTPGFLGIRPLQFFSWRPGHTNAFLNRGLGVCNVASAGWRTQQSREQVVPGHCSVSEHPLQDKGFSGGHGFNRRLDWLYSSLSTGTALSARRGGATCSPVSRSERRHETSRLSAAR
jgi:hypothetical protein